ncbi:MAG TPA: NUDIX domain-containing protein [Polyangiaceae bacterium]|nr:NUDIX domain-containing protein [Polyangiaceae bacterium]
MSADDAPLEFPGIRLEVVEDLSPADQDGFLRLRRRRYVAHYPDGTRSEPFVYDEVDREAMDAVVIAAHYVQSGERYVFLRSAVRPPVAMRDRRPLDEPDRGGALWELPAGLVEVEEWSRDGVARCARRELLEEVGLEVPLASLKPLGPNTYPAPGVIGERHIYLEVTVDPRERREPELDGSALEQFGAVVAVRLTRALDLCRSGEIEDAKTEVALRRLLERLA